MKYFLIILCLYYLKDIFMIQRIQTVYLLFVFIVCIALFFTPISLYKNVTKNLNDTNTSQDIIKYDLRGLKRLSAGTEIKLVTIYAIPGIVATIGAIAFITMLLFKRRSLQLKLCKLLLILNILLILMLLFYVEKEVNAISNTWTATYLIGMYIPIVTLFLLYLANGSIKKDDDLVKSSDRLR